MSEEDSIQIGIPENLPENLPENSSENPYEKLLIENEEDIHAIVQDIVNTKTRDIKATKLVEMAGILKYFSGSTPHKQKEALLEFLNIMPEYKTTNMDLMEKRLTGLKNELKRRGEICDLLIWAKLKYQNQNE